MHSQATTTVLTADDEQTILLKAFVNYLPHQAYIKDAEGRFLFANAVTAEFMGVGSAQELIGKTDFDFHEEALATEFYADEIALIQSGEALVDKVERVINLSTQEEQWLSSTKIPVKDSRGEVRWIVGLNRDITYQKKLEDERSALLRKLSTLNKELAHSAYHDALTGLANRTAFMNHLKQHLDPVLGRPDASLLFIDLDHFKTINDTLGHKVGDTVLKEVAKRLTKSVRGTDYIARLGGDEFVILLSTSDSTITRQVAERVRSQLDKPLVYESNTVAISASIGVRLIDKHHTCADDILNEADQAMYDAKTTGKNKVCVFDT